MAKRKRVQQYLWRVAICQGTYPRTTLDGVAPDMNTAVEKAVAVAWKRKSLREKDGPVEITLVQRIGQKDF